jgi:hypothetical protein
MPITIPGFIGEVPRMHPRMLPETAAQLAENVFLERGSLNPATQEEAVTTIAGSPVYFVRHDGDWLGYATPVDAVQGPVAQDRLYITGDGTPKLRYDGAIRELAAQAPISAPTVTPGAVTDEDLEEATAFAYTFVTDLGEETEPSPLSAYVNLAPDQEANVSNFSAPDASRGFEKMRIYKTVTSLSGTTDLYFVAEVTHTALDPYGVLNYNPDAYTLAEVIASTDFNTPVASLTGITAMPNGMMAAFSGRDLYFCEPYQPHAWPVKYALKTDTPIVALCAFGSMLAILTEGTPYRAQGTAPENMVMEKVEENLPCVAPRGAVDIGYACVYPSTEGLVLMSGSGANIMSAGLFTLDQWRAMGPATFRAGHFNGRYIFSHLPAGAGGRQTGLIDLRAEQPFLVQGDLAALSFVNSQSDGKLYAMTAGGNVVEWRPSAAAPKSFAWRSKLFELPYPENFACIKIDGTAYDEAEGGTAAFACKVYADGSLIHTVSALNAPARLPSGFKAHEWEIEITGNAEIERIVLAETMEELAR